MRRPHDNPRLAGNYAPVHDELDVADLAIDGDLPRALSGTYMRNGPNPFYEPIAYQYPFDGDGMIHAVTIRDGKASYRNRFVDTAGLRSERRNGRALYGSLVAPVEVDPALLDPDDDPSPFKNGAFVNIIRHAGTYLALLEAAPGYEMNANFETLGLWQAGSGAPIPVNAHVRPDPATGELWTMSYDPVDPPYVQVRLIGADGRLRKTINVDLDAPTMMHDFIVTERNVVLLHGPLDFDWEAAGRGASPLAWRKRGSRFGILSKDGDGSDVRWVEGDPFFVFHFANAFERDGRIVTDYARHAWLDFGTDVAEEAPPPALTRAVVDPVAGTVEEHRWHEAATEFPRFDDRLDGLPYRRFFAPCAMAAEGQRFNALLQIDGEGGAAAVSRLGDRVSIGEAVFAPDPSRTGETEGWIMAFVYDEDSDGSDLVLWDAASVAAGPVCRIRMPRRVPEGLHGNWMADPA